MLTNYKPNADTPAGKMRIIKRMFLTGKLAYAEAEIAIYKTVTRHKYSEEARKAATALITELNKHSL